MTLPPQSPQPALLQTLRFIRDPFSLAADAQRQLGDVFSLRLLGMGEWVFLCSPELVKAMFKAPTDVLAAGEVNTNQLGFMLGKDTTFSLDGQAHLDRRRIVHPHLNGRRVHQHVNLMREVTTRAISKWPSGKEFSFLPHAHKMALDILMNAMFHSSGREKVEQLASLFDEFASKGLRSSLIVQPALQLDFGRYSPWGKIKHLQRIVFDVFGKEIAGRVAGRDEGAGGEDEGQDSDIVSMLIQAKQSDGSHIPQQTLLHEVLTLLFAGHETTGNILTWTLETILSRPAVLDRLQSELESVLNGDPIQASHLSELKYLDAVIHESIRYRPIAPFAGVRLVKKEFSAGDYTLPPGMIVTHCFAAMCQQKSLFKRPEEFDPEHFYERKFQPFEWNPFGGGTRMCTGRGMAEVELKVMLATLLQRAKLSLAQKNVKPVRHGVFFAPNKGLLVTGRPRL